MFTQANKKGLSKRIKRTSVAFKVKEVMTVNVNYFPKRCKVLLCYIHPSFRIVNTPESTFLTSTTAGVNIPRLLWYTTTRRDINSTANISTTTMYGRWCGTTCIQRFFTARDRI